MNKSEYETLGEEFEALIKKWDDACLADSNEKTKTIIATETINFYETNSKKIHLLENDLRIIDEIKMFLFFNNR